MSIERISHSSLFLSLSLLPVLASAQPVVSGIEGSIIDGQTITVSGSGFGDFGGRIISWDDFEGQKTGETVNGSKSKIGAGWTTQFGYEGAAIVFDDLRAISGRKSIKIDWSQEINSNIKAFGWSGQSPIDKIYISYWRFMEGDYTPADGDNHKQFYLFGSNGEFPQFMPLIPAGQWTWYIYNNVGSSRSSGLPEKNSQSWTWVNTSDEFQRWEWHVELNSPVDAYNGAVRGWMDGVLGFNFDDYRLRSVDGTFDDFRLGHMAKGMTDTAKAWFDDVYAATTPARIEICGVSTWEECGKTKSLQIPHPEKWSDNSVTVTIRESGRFGGQTGFLYVVDADGNVSAPYSLDGLGGSTAPNPPALEVF